MINEKIEKDIKLWLEEEKWIIEDVKRFNQNIIDYIITLTNNQKLDLIIDRDFDRIIIKRSFNLSNEFQTNKLTSFKDDFLSELKIFLMVMDIYIQIDPTSANSESINIMYYLYFDGFSKNKFIHSMYKMEEIIDLCINMQKKFIDRHRTLSH